MPSWVWRAANALCAWAALIDAAPVRAAMRLARFAGVICCPPLILAGIQQIIDNVPNAIANLLPRHQSFVLNLADWCGEFGWSSSLIPIQVLKSESSALAPAQGGIYGACGGKTMAPGLKEKLIKIGAKVVGPSRYVAFQMTVSPLRELCSPISCD